MRRTSVVGVALALLLALALPVVAQTTRSPLASIPSGTAALGIVQRQYAGGPFHQTIIQFTNAAIPSTDNTTNGAQAPIQLLDFPAGVITIVGASSNLTIVGGAGLTATAAVVCSLGSVTAAVDATLTSTEADWMPSTTATLTGSAGACKGEITTALLAVQDGTSTAKDLWLNFAVPDAGSTANTTITVNGTVTVTWIFSQDN